MTKDEALKLALEALEQIALAGMSGTGQESKEAMTEWHARQAWKFISIAARSLEPVKEALAQPEQEPNGYVQTVIEALYENGDPVSVDAGDGERKNRMNEHQQKEFERVTRPVIEWLNVNWHPHVTVVITTTSAELSSGEIAYSTTEYVRD